MRFRCCAMPTPSKTVPRYRALRRECRKVCARHYWTARAATYKYEACIARCVAQKTRACMKHDQVAACVCLRLYIYSLIGNKNTKNLYPTGRTP